MNSAKPPLYRKHNKLAYLFRHRSAPGSFRHDRNTKALQRFEGSHRSMARSREGYDYTPLYRFLLSKVGHNWDDVFSEAVSRLDKQEPVFRLVDLHYHTGMPGTVRLGENSYYTRLTVHDGILVVADPHAQPPEKRCTCCTWTFNGVPY